jgi:hypothetical protein
LHTRTPTTTIHAPFDIQALETSGLQQGIHGESVWSKVVGEAVDYFWGARKVSGEVESTGVDLSSRNVDYAALHVLAGEVDSNI